MPESHREYKELVNNYVEFKKHAEIIERDKEIVTRRMEVVKVLKKFDPSEKLVCFLFFKFLLFFFN